MPHPLLSQVPRPLPGVFTTKPVLRILCGIIAPRWLILSSAVSIPWLQFTLQFSSGVVLQIDKDHILLSFKSAISLQSPGILSNHRESFHAVGPKHSDLHLFRFKCGIFILNIIVSQSKENDGCKTCEHSIVPKTKQEREIQQIMLSLR